MNKNDLFFIWLGTNNRVCVMVKATIEGRSPFCIAGSRLCFLTRDGRNICLHDNSIAKRFPRIAELTASELIINALASASDDVLFSGGYDNTVKKWNLTSLACEGSVNLNSCINGLCASSDGSAYAVRSDGGVTHLA